MITAIASRPAAAAARSWRLCSIVDMEAVQGGDVTCEGANASRAFAPSFDVVETLRRRHICAAAVPPAVAGTANDGASSPGVDGIASIPPPVR